jgi:hypothetical protein
MKKKRIFTRTAVHAAPRRFLLIALLSDGGLDSTLVSHLVRVIEQERSAIVDGAQNDDFFISHYHSSSDGFPNVAEANGIAGSDDDSISSVVKRNPAEEPRRQQSGPLISMEVSPSPP